ncbi:MAG: NADH:ubiquinone oxidoreductase, partial [Spirochaetes bacterium]|nr:NADH:ubiquinone oxidoreductase [Spirochaetota bacterium]
MGIIKDIKIKCFKKSLWVFHLAASACNNCDIEILDLLTPRFDIERFGMVLTGSIKHADVLLVTGIVNKKAKKRVQELYKMAPKPIVVVAVGACPITGIMFTESYNMAGPLDKVIP